MRFDAISSVYVSALLAAAVSASAQDSYPSRPVQIVAPAAGVSTDVMARIIADKLTRRLGQPVIVQNRPGAAGTIAAQAVASAAPDGYTLLMVNAAHVVNNFLYQNLPFDSLRDFSGVALVAEAPMVVVVSPVLNVRTANELIALAKQKPGTINYASAGFGSTTHLAGALFASRAGIEMVHVPYKAMGNIVTDMLSGRTQASFVPAVFLLPQIREGKLHAIAVTSRGPMNEPFALASVREATGVDYEFTSWNGVLAPAKTPLPILERVGRAIQQSADEEDVKEKFRAMGQTLRIVMTREFDAYMKADADRVALIVKAAGVAASKPE